MTENHQPYISIGVPTYKRGKLLSETLSSILGQSFSDFEILVGNDDVTEILPNDPSLINDSRIHWINHKKNLGELANMNELLAQAKGRYFTWLNDDDLYHHEFLSKIHSTLLMYPKIQCVFTGFRTFKETREIITSSSVVKEETQLFTGAAFIKEYFSGRLQTMGVNGVFITETLRKFGGLTSLSPSPFALYAEYLLLIQSAQIPQVAYKPQPLVFYRAHADSWGCSNYETQLYRIAGQNLVRLGMVIFASENLRSNFTSSLNAILRLAFTYLIAKLPPNQLGTWIPTVLALIRGIRNDLHTLKPVELRKKARICLILTGSWATWHLSKKTIKRLALSVRIWEK